MATVEGVTGFDRASVPLRGELLAHCYRMLGSWDEAEDAVQETLLRGWRGWGAFDRRASARTWLHRIATNVCLNAVRDRGRRALPAGLGAPGPAGEGPLVSPGRTELQPFAGDGQDLRLALIAALQELPPRQRAALLLCDTLGFPAAEAAEVLGTTVPGVKGALKRARARLTDVAPRADDVVEPQAPAARRLLHAYVTAFESGEIDVLLDVLRADATLELVPPGARYAGKELCSRVLRDAVGSAGDWTMRPTVANGQPAVAAYRYGQPFGIAVLDVRESGIAGITVFAQPGLVDRFLAHSAT